MLSDDSDGEDIQQLTINEHYAKAFEYRKEREELAKLKERYGSDVDENDAEEEDSEDLESEDEDGEELTPALDAAILRTLARIKRKDPSIYEDGKDVFQEEIKKTGEAKIFKHSSEDKSKPITIRQHVLASTLNPSSRSPSPEPITHVKEQEALRSETIAAFHTSAPDAEDDDDFLIPREKTKDELEREEEEYKEFLQREVGEDLKGLITVEEGDFLNDAEDEAESSQQEKKQAKEKKRDKKDKKAKKSERSKKEEDQEFLMNYILNRGWIDKSTKRLPTYKEITSSRKGKERALEDDSEEEAIDAQSEAPENEIDEDEFDEVAERFETSYNFRFEEPGADQIARYPRNIESLVRREDSTRKEAREKRKARKEEELLKKKEEVKRLKALKMKEVRTKLEWIGREGGKNLEDTKALEALDLDGDWDPDAHDKQMADIYGQDDDDAIDDEKPQWEDDIDITDIVPNAEESEDEGAGKKKKKKKKKKQKGGDSADEGGVDVDEMDADVEMEVDEEEWDGTEEMRKRKLDEYMDEVYGLEFNDLVGGMPTRFRYTKVQPQNFALTPAEILLATDAELNQYMGIKKYAPYRKDGSNWDKNRAARLRELKAKIGERRKAFEGGSGGGGDVFADASAGGHDKPAKKRKGKKERLRAKALAGEQDDDEQDDEVDEEPMTGKEDTRSKRDRTEEATGESAAVEGDSQKQPKKRKRRHKKSGQEEVVNL
ncbi:hypothetical protein EIP86_010038 [Pleurotus ostreatoroseus]|nr:hypothetical protein EIP86_010038 [Pleurotus ostreatoroseus]